jgi:hypothetical protein
LPKVALNNSNLPGINRIASSVRFLWLPQSALIRFPTEAHMGSKTGIAIGFLAGFILTGALALLGFKMARDEFDARTLREKDAAYQKGISEGASNARAMLEETAVKALRDENAALKKRIEELEKK